MITAALQHDGVAPEIARRAARLSVGCPGKAVQLCQGENLAQAEARRRAITGLFTRLPHARFQVGYRLLEEQRFESFLTEVEGVWRDLWLERVGPRAAVADSGVDPELTKLAARVGLDQIDAGLRAIRRWRYLNVCHVNKKLSLEWLMLRAFPKNYSLK